jgi:hypothetical protein
LQEGCNSDDGFFLCRQLFIELSDTDLDNNFNNQITFNSQSFLPGMSVSREFIGLRNGSEVSFAPKGEGRGI